jgi:plasmid maintenance system killer protein
MVNWLCRIVCLYLESALDVNDLLAPPGNRLEKLHLEREGHCSIRANNRLRICFRQEGGKAFEVGIVDFHLEENYGNFTMHPPRGSLE